MIRLAKEKGTDEQKMIDQIINLLKEHPTVQSLFKKYKIPLDRINDVPIEFGDMDVSAKAKKGRITLNSNLLKDNSFIEDLHYIVHELVHVLQFYGGKLDDMKIYPTEHYLENPLELEAFKEQAKFIAKYKSDKEADEYIQKLLKFHGYNGKEKEEKFRQLRGE